MWTFHCVVCERHDYQEYDGQITCWPCVRALMQKLGRPPTPDEQRNGMAILLARRRPAAPAGGGDSQPMANVGRGLVGGITATVKRIAAAIKKS